MDDTQRQDAPHDDQERSQQPEGTSSTQESSAARDLGTVGGGNIPHPLRSDGEQANDGGEPLKNEKRDPALQETPTNDARAVNRHSKSNVATRDPGQPQTAMGDRDSTFGGRDAGANEETSDPMISHAPDKVNSPSEQQNT